MSTIGFYYNCFKNKFATEQILIQTRKNYPQNPIFLMSDKGHDFSDLANKYNCKYYYSEINILGGRIINNNIPNDCLLFQNIGQKDNLVSDWFHISSNEIMNIVCSLFLKLKYLNNTKGYLKQIDRLPITLWDTSECSCSPEIFIRDYLFLLKIPWKGVNFNINLSNLT